MKILQRNIYWILCTIILTLISLCVMHMTKSPYPKFSISNNSRTQEVSIYDAEDDNCYVFLPSYADMDQVSVVMPQNQKITLGDITLSNGTNCDTFDLETPYTFTIGNRTIGTLWFYRSSNVATIYIDTATGNMEYIHEDKNNEEHSTITIYTVDGKINHHSENNILKGRGNQTWGQDKRPYSLKLSSAADLLNMGTASNWVLLANAMDETNLKNYLVFNLASRAGFAWTPECRYADVYLNGEYSGLYLLTEKVEAGINRLNIDSTAGEFLCKFDPQWRQDTIRNPFSTNSGRTVEMTYPDTPQRLYYTNAISQVNKMETAILSGENSDLSNTIDLDSWVRRYLVDEISGNIDSDFASSYFYFSNGIFYAGPVWDYDMSFGNNIRNQDPCAFLAKMSRYNRFLYANETFYNRMVDTYRLNFLPPLQKMIDTEIPDISSCISCASTMNNIRWRFMYDQLRSLNPGTIYNATDLISYLKQRINFLNSAWLENTDYCTIQFIFSPDVSYKNITLPKGASPNVLSEDITSTVWIDSSTGEMYDLSKPVMTDLYLIAHYDDVSSSSFSIRDYVFFLSIAVFFIFFLSLLVYDIIPSKMDKENRK